MRGSERGTVTVPATLATNDREALLVAAQSGAGLFRIGMFSPELIDSGRLVLFLTNGKWPGGPAPTAKHVARLEVYHRIRTFLLEAG